MKTAVIGMIKIALVCLCAFFLWQSKDEFKCLLGDCVVEQDSAQEPESDTFNMINVPEEVSSKVINYPGFVVGFNKHHHQPNYVFWEITRNKLIDRVIVHRTDNFAPDPYVVGCAQLEDYRGSGFDRGHMAPAADMKWSLDAMNASFLLTNMSPQNHALNDGAWKKLEEKCREWALCDSSIYVICGPVLNDNIVRFIGNNRVSVPLRYFKVVFSPYSNPPRGIGFIMPNMPVKGGMQACACSIDEVEAVTGFDFFPYLDEELEQIVESKYNFNDWPTLKKWQKKKFAI